MEQLEDEIVLQDRHYPDFYIGGEFHNASFQRDTLRFQYKVEGSVTQALVDEVLDPKRYINKYNRLFQEVEDLNADDDADSDKTQEEVPEIR